MVFFVKKVENGKYFVKSGPFLNAGCIMYSINFILHFTYLGGAYAPNAPPCLRAWIASMPRFLTGDGVVKTYLMKNDD